LGKAYNTTAGHYLIVGPNWDGSKPEGIKGVVRSATNLANIIPRIFLDNTKEDEEAIQPLINGIISYSVSKYDGSTKTISYRDLPALKMPPKPEGEASAKSEAKYVFPETFFDDDQLGLVLKEVTPLPGEEAIYSNFRQLLDVVKNDPEIKKACIVAINQTEQEAIAPLMSIDYMPAVGNGWHSTPDVASFGYDYYSRTEIAKSSMFGNKVSEWSHYILIGRNGWGVRMMMM